MKRGQLTRKTELKAKKPLPHAARPGDRIQRQKPMPRLCTVCGYTFIPEKRNGIWTRQCSAECAKKAVKPPQARAKGDCPVCGKPRAIGAANRLLKTCGDRECVNELVRRSKLGDKNPSKKLRQDGPRNKWGQVCIEKKCKVCGENYLTPATYSSIRRTCSHRCAGILKSQEHAGTRKGRSNPNYKHGKRTGERDRVDERRWFDGAPRTCENPECLGRDGRTEGHHCFYKQMLRREGGDIWDPRNRFVLCRDCHKEHHGRRMPIALTSLPDSVYEFGVELLGPGAAYEYLRKRYRGQDPRLDALLSLSA